MNRTPVADWQRLSALYELADALDPDSLGDWLAELREQAHPLLAQLEQMLAARSQVRHNGFLATLPRLPALPEPAMTSWQAGSRIGPYRMLRKLGSGGMAEVWLAERDDGAFQRQVAIKLLFRDQGSNRRDSFAQRFDRERDILASLDHPHIAGLHDAGVTPDGQPWLALEYVEGESLTAWCDAQRLGVEARVRLFRQVLLAVQHAHANLVIHRDLKPANILVTAQGEVRLLDFGIAKLMEPEGAASVDTELTRIAGRPMTPQYAAPEQLLGQPLTTSCDVYSLGVVLYELLCGERPYELKVESAAQLEQAILDEEPRAPSRRLLAGPVAQARGTSAITLRKQLANDLDAITLRALAKSPGRRYGSVEAFGVDLDHWLEGEPVEARSPTTIYRIGKFVRRHTLSVALGVGAAVSLVVVASAAVVMGMQARDDSARAGAARDFMLSLFQRADQEKSRGADITARDLLETGRKDVLTRLAGQPALQIELLRGIAKIQSDMGEYVTAEDTFSELVRVHAALHQPREEAMAHADRAYNALQKSDLALAVRELRAATAVRGRPAADDVLNARLAEVAGRIALNSGDAQRARAMLVTARQTAVERLGKHHLRSFRLGQELVQAERALSNFAAAVSLNEELRRTADRVVGLEAAEVVAIDFEDVNLRLAAGQFADGLKSAETALSRCVESRGAGDQGCRLLFLRRSLFLLRLGMHEQVFADVPRLELMSQDATLPLLQSEALLLRLRVQATKPKSADFDRLVERVLAFGESGSAVVMKPVFKANALLAVAEVELCRSNTAAARAWSQRALVLLGSGVKRGSSLRTAAVAQMIVSIALRQEGRPDEALRESAEARFALDRSLGPQHPITQIYVLNDALSLAALGRLPEAIEVVEKATFILRPALGEGSPAFHEVALLGARLRAEAAGNFGGEVKPHVGHEADGVCDFGRSFFS